jgi:hypothetical protein
MRSGKPTIAILLLSLLLVSGCAKRKENLTSDDEKLIPVYTDLLVLSEEYKASPAPPDTAVYQREVDSLLSSHGMTREELTYRLTLLARSPMAYQQFNERVRKDLEHKKPKQTAPH